MATFVSGARWSIFARTHTHTVDFIRLEKGRASASERVVITHQSVDSEQIAISGGSNSSLSHRGKTPEPNRAEKTPRQMLGNRMPGAAQL